MKLNIFAAVLEALSGLAPSGRKSRVALRNEPANVSNTATVTSIQSAIRSAEGGDARQLFALYRDITAGGSHIQAEMNKRKLAMLAQPMAILPFDKTSKDDMAAAVACQQMVQRCENWNDAITHLLDSCMWPVAVAERVYRPADAGDGAVGGSLGERTLPGVRFWLSRIVPVNPQVLCFRKPSNWKETQGDAIWEPDLRFYPTDEDGRILYVVDQSYAAEPARHIVHRGHLLVGLRDNWGGPMRAAVFWWLLSALGRDWFARAMERYGVPFPVGHTDGKDSQAVKLLQEAFALATKIGGLVVDHETQIELKEIALSGTADAHEKWLTTCNREISKLIVGQTLSSDAQNTGLGSSVGKLQGEVREDIRQFDQIKMGETVRKQVFEPWLRVNGIRGNAPKPVWGGLSDADAKVFAETLQILKQAGWEPTDEAVPTVNERLGFPVQRVAAPAPAVSVTGVDGLFSRKDAETQSGDKGTTDKGTTDKGTTDKGTTDKGTTDKGTTEEPKDRNTEEPQDRNTETPKDRNTEEPTTLGASRLGVRLRLLSAQSRMADSLGVPPAWLNPVRDFLEELQAKAADATLSEQDLLDFMDAAVKRVPELFSKMDVDELAKVLEAGMGEAVLDGVRRGVRNNHRINESVSQRSTEAPKH